MSKPVSQFSGYSQKENRVTNYILLMLRMLYEESPSYLSEVFGQLLPDEISTVIGVSFNQQVRKGSSVPDGLITQSALSIFIEAKNHDWFYNAQIERHLDALNSENSGVKVLMLLGNIEADIEARFEDVHANCRKKYDGEIFFQVVTFENLLEALGKLDIPKKLQDSVAELEYFFDEQNLLPRWKEKLDVVNCSGSLEEVLEHGIYTCPTIGGAYSHRRCRYFGAYNDKKVGVVSEIIAVIDYDSEGEERVNWNNTEEKQDALIAKGFAKLKAINQTGDSVRVFLLGERFETNFVKDTKGGMQQSKLYFNVAELNAKNAKELAGSLANKRWTDLR